MHLHARDNGWAQLIGRRVKSQSTFTIHRAAWEIFEVPGITLSPCKLINFTDTESHAYTYIEDAGAAHICYKRPTGTKEPIGMGLTHSIPEVLR